MCTTPLHRHTQYAFDVMFYRKLPRAQVKSSRLVARKGVRRRRGRGAVIPVDSDDPAVLPPAPVSTGTAAGAGSSASASAGASTGAGAASPAAMPSSELQPVRRCLIVRLQTPAEPWLCPVPSCSMPHATTEAAMLHLQRVHPKAYVQRVWICVPAQPRRTSCGCTCFG